SSRRTRSASRATELASGLTLLFRRYGLTAIFGADYVGKRINGLQSMGIPLLGDLPFLCPVLFQGDLLCFGMLPMAGFVCWLLYRTRWGLSLRTVGESRVVAYASGLSPQR